MYKITLILHGGVIKVVLTHTATSAGTLIRYNIFQPNAIDANHCGEIGMSSGSCYSVDIYSTYIQLHKRLLMLVFH